MGGGEEEEEEEERRMLPGSDRGTIHLASMLWLVDLHILGGGNLTSSTNLARKGSIES